MGVVTQQRRESWRRQLSFIDDYGTLKPHEAGFITDVRRLLLRDAELSFPQSCWLRAIYNRTVWERG